MSSRSAVRRAADAFTSRGACARPLASAPTFASSSRSLSSLSRPRASLPRPFSPLPSSSRTLLTIPHPDLSSENGTTRLIVRIFNDPPTSVHSIAVARAVESKLGPIFSLEIPKNFDTLRPSNTLYITLLRPVKLSEPLVLEIPAPSISDFRRVHLGGPGWEDFRKAMSDEPKVTSEMTQAPAGSRRPVQFRVEARQAPVRTRRNKKMGSGPVRSRSMLHQLEDDRVVKALRKFEGGFFGGFEGLAEKLAWLEKQEVVEEVVVEEGGSETAAEVEAEVEAFESEEAVNDIAEPSIEIEDTADLASTVEPTETETDAVTPADPETRPKSKRERMLEQALASARLDFEAKRAAEESAASAVAAEAAAEADRVQGVSSSERVEAETEGEKKGGSWFSRG